MFYHNIWGGKKNRTERTTAEIKRVCLCARAQMFIREDWFYSRSIALLVRHETFSIQLKLYQNSIFFVIPDLKLDSMSASMTSYEIKSSSNEKAWTSHAPTRKKHTSCFSPSTTTLYGCQLGSLRLSSHREQSSNAFSGSAAPYFIFTAFTNGFASTSPILFTQMLARPSLKTCAGET